MSYLDSESQERLGAMLEEGTPVEIEEEKVETSSQEESEVKEVPSEESGEKVDLVPEPAPETVEATQVEGGEGQQEPGLSDDGEEDPGSHRVPYNRFKQVIDARNQLRNERDILSEQLSGLTAQVEEFRSNSQQPQAAEPQAQRLPHGEAASIPDFLTEEEVQYFDGMQKRFGAQYDNLESRLQKYEMANAERQLEAEIGHATEKYPDVPRRAILEAVANGNVNVMDVAERYSSFVNQMREKAIADYLEAQPTQDGAPPKVAPRPSKAGGSTVSTGSLKPEDRPKNLQDASRALNKFLKTNNLF
jgi:hypothetical protein